jgi:hypothetical protein
MKRLKINKVWINDSIIYEIEKKEFYERCQASRLCSISANMAKMFSVTKLIWDQLLTLTQITLKMVNSVQVSIVNSIIIKRYSYV